MSDKLELKYDKNGKLVPTIWPCITTKEDPYGQGKTTSTASTASKKKKRTV